MPKKVTDYDTFCDAVEMAVGAANTQTDTYRYEIARLEEGGFFHVCLMRMIGIERPTFHLARALMGVFYPDMSKEEFMALADHVVSGRTKIEEFDAIPIHVLFESFCERP